jgi:hypothetical protein
MFRLLHVSYPIEFASWTQNHNKMAETLTQPSNSKIFPKNVCLLKSEKNEICRLDPNRKFSQHKVCLVHQKGMPIQN